mgnify:CR=1 FL=1
MSDKRIKNNRIEENKLKKVKEPENLGAVHTHTHTRYLRKKNSIFGYAEYSSNYFGYSYAL